MPRTSLVCNEPDSPETPRAIHKATEAACQQAENSRLLLSRREPLMSSATHRHATPRRLPRAARIGPPLHHQRRRR